MRLSFLYFASPFLDLSGHQGAAPLHEFSRPAYGLTGGTSQPLGVRLLRRQGLPGLQPLLQPHTITLPLDHNATTDVSFENRFWLNATYYEPGGPVFLYDIGEANGQSTAQSLLRETNGPTPIMRLAERYKGLALAIEHRFYGESVPSNATKSFTPAWKYHTVDQALADVVRFAKSFPKTADPSATPADPLKFYAVNPQQVPWIGLGGSYAGARIAFLRERHPEIIYAGWGSSVCSGGEVAAPGYFTVIQNTLRANCSADWAAIRQYVDQNLDDPSPEAQQRLRFGGDLEREALLIPSLGFQVLGPHWMTDRFCDALETHDGRQEATPEGLVATEGIERAYDVYSSLLAPDMDIYQEEMRLLETDQTYQSWTYQECTELGGFRVHDPQNPNSFVSRAVTEESIAQACAEAYPRSFVPQRPNVDALNKYGGWDVNPSNFFFADGELDPWRIVTPSWPKKSGTLRLASESIPKCNSRPPLEQYFGKVYAGAMHVPDYSILAVPDQFRLEDNRDAENYNTSMRLFQQALDEWLPCFGKSTQPPASGPTGGAYTLRTHLSNTFIAPLVLVAFVPFYL